MNKIEYCIAFWASLIIANLSHIHWSINIVWLLFAILYGITWTLTPDRKLEINIYKQIKTNEDQEEKTPKTKIRKSNSSS